MSPPVFLDSGIFIAFLNQRDRWHPQAAGLFNGPRPAWCSSYLVVSEAYSWFLHRMGEEEARTFRAFLDTLDGLKMLDADAEHHRLTLRALDRFHGAKLTYVDASSLAWLERLRIRRVWSTDHHLAMTGAEVIPRS